MPGLQASITDAFKSQFSDTVYRIAQQTMARMRSYVDIRPMNAEDLLLDRIGSIEAQELNTRFPIITPADVQWDRRRVAATRIGVAQFVDDWDAERLLTDPRSILAQRAAESLERKFDRIALTALTATVLTGRDGAVPVTAAADGVQTVDATGGFTYETLLRLSSNFQKNEVGTETPIRKCLVITEQEHEQLMKEGTLINGDFSKQYVVDKGYMTRALDFDILVYGSNMPNPMVPVVNGVRQCLCFASGAVVIGLSKAWDIKVKERNERWDTDQILASGRLGGTRMEGTKVQIVQTTAS